MLHPFTKRLQNTHNCTHFIHSSPVNCRHAIAPPRTLTPLWHSARHVSVNSRRTDRLPLPSSTPPYSFTTLPLAAALHTLPSWCLFISFVFCACVKSSYRLNPLTLPLSVSVSMSIRNRIHISLLSSQVVAPSSPLPLSLSGIPLLPLRVTLEGSSTSASASASASALPLPLFSALLAWPAFPLTLTLSLPFTSPSLSASLLLFLLLSSLALALASASHLVIICIEKCQSQRAAQPPHDNRSDFPSSHPLLHPLLNPPLLCSVVLLSECPFCLCLLHFSLSTVTL